MGHSTLAVSVVVSAFLSGLVIGSVWFGRLADRLRHPLLGYAALEAATGGCALGLTWLFPRLEPLLVSLGLPGGGPLWTRAIIVFALILLPTAAMGGTLPMLTRAMAREAEQVGRSFGWLYTLNTFGAAVGCGVTGFVLIGKLGLFGSALLAAAVNVSVALLAVALHRWRRSEPLPVVASKGLSTEGSAFRSALIGAFAVSGFASISYEVLWFRVLSTFLSATSYAFTLMLVVFLLGLALGAALYAWKLSRHSRPMSLLVACQSALAFSALLSMVLLGQDQLLRTAAELATGGHVGMLVKAGLVMIVPTTLIGICFPLVIQLTANRLDRVGGDVGFLYSVNTIGGIIGSLVTGLWLVPWLGTQRSFSLMTILSFGVALFLLRFDRDAAAGARRSLLASGMVLLLSLLLLPSDYLRNALAHREHAQLLEIREGRDGTTYVLEHTRASLCATHKYKCGAECTRDFSYRQLLFGHISYASTILSDRRYMRALAHLPMLLNPDPKRALEICFGTGTTAAAFAAYPGLESLRIVDINPDVVALARHFEDSNNGVLKDPRTHVAIEDGRHFLLATDERFDVVSLEPPPPVDAGIVNLYSREFYSHVRARLRPGGILAQWLPLGQQNRELDRRLVAAALAEFPHVSLWMASRLEAVLIASSAPLHVDLAEWKARQSPASTRSLAEVGFTPETLLGTYVMGTEGLKRFVADAPPVSDDKPSIEYFLSFSGPELQADELMAHAEKPSSLIPDASPEDKAAVDRAGDATALLTGAHVLAEQSKTADARAKVAEARALIGDDAYLSHLLAVEYGCMELAD